ncbi:MAG: glycerophosphodiester phosphodiesterase family protein [Clostridia bacterium]|nr:glycerophosphodiester phosphodiesterase family protein [Clostridia bacterium]
MILPYISKKSKEIYELLIADEGLHRDCPGNTIKAFENAVEMGLAIKIDVRYLKDNSIVCFHDKYMFNKLGIPGKIENCNFDIINKYMIEKTKNYVPTLEQAISVIDGRVPIILDVKTNINDKFLKKLENVLLNYSGTVYFQTAKFKNYIKLKNIFGKKVFLSTNILRKRFDYCKDKDYKNMPTKLFNVSDLPSLTDILIGLESEDKLKNLIKKMWYASNKSNSRIKDDHWLNTHLKAHRMIVDPNICENSVEAIKYIAKLNQNTQDESKRYAAEIDVTIRLEKNRFEFIVYHDDKYSDKLGQPKSCANKVKIESASQLKEILEIANGIVPLIFDLKFSVDKRFISRKNIARIVAYFDKYVSRFLTYDYIQPNIRCKKYDTYVVMSPDPRTLIEYAKINSEIIRLQVGNSIDSLREFSKRVPIWINFILFYKSNPDGIVYNVSPTVYALAKFNIIIGHRIYLYAPRTKEEGEPYLDFCDGFIGEGKFFND